MRKTAILTDSNSGITQAEAKELGVYVMPMPFFINDKLYFEEVDLGMDEFYDKLKSTDIKITTSMPAVGDLIDKWDELLEEYEDIVYIPMSSGLSSSCSAATALIDEYDGRVQVINNRRISVTQRLSCIEALRMAEQGKNAVEIREFLEATASDSSIYITVGTLEYLKRGGRLTSAVATIGTFLKVKPVLQIQGDKLDTYSMARTMKQAENKMLDAIEHDMKNRFNDSDYNNFIISIAHTQELKEAEKFREDVIRRFPNRDVLISPLPLSISCHIGPGSLAVTTSVKHDIMK
ncbi:MAG: DegV family protein [Lachnospiraceae bacterium]|nr:DegV family protein [Lachnospiraceae bacterium]